MRTCALVAAVLLSLVADPSGAQRPADAPLRVLSSNGIRVALERLIADAERAIDGRIAVRYSSSAALKQSIDQGEAFDVAILTPELVAGLVRGGALRSETTTDLASIDLAVGARAGTPSADVSTADGMRRRLLAARSLTWTEGGAASAANFAMIEALGLRDQLAARIVLQRVPGTAAEAVARGEHELVLLPLSEIQHVPGVIVLGLHPPSFQRPVVMTAGMSARTGASAAAAEFIAFLRSPAAARVLEAAGMRPAR